MGLIYPTPLLMSQSTYSLAYGNPSNHVCIVQHEFQRTLRDLSSVKLYPTFEKRPFHADIPYSTFISVEWITLKTDIVKYGIAVVIDETCIRRKLDRVPLNHAKFVGKFPNPTMK